MWGAVAISPCADLCTKFWVHLFGNCRCHCYQGCFGLLNQSGALRQRHQHGGIEQFPVAEVVAKEVALASAL